MSGHVGERSPLRTFGLLSLRRRYRLVAGCGALFLIASLFFIMLRPAKYTSTTQLLVYLKQLQPGPDLVITLGRADLTQVQNEIEIIQSRGMLARVVSALNLADDDEIVRAPTLFQALWERILRGPKWTSEDSSTRMERAVDFLKQHFTVKRVGTSHTIQVSVTTSDPYQSERIANAIARVTSQAHVSAEQEGSRSPLLRERLQGLGPNAYIMTTAGAAGRRDGPRKILIVLAALFAGLAVGSVLALILDFMNRTMRTAAQVEYFGLECIGAIPRLRQWPPIDAGSPVSNGERTDAVEFLPNAMLDQTLRRMMTSIAASRARTIGITSAIAQEGATTVAKYLAQMAALSRKKVLLVEAGQNEAMPLTGNERGQITGASDKRRPRNGVALDEYTGLDVLKIDHASSAHDAAAWRKRCDPDRLGRYDLVVVNLPPLESGPEFRMTAQDLDGILVVIKWGSAEFDRIERAIAESDVAPSEFIGAVLNMVDDRMIGKFGDKLWEAEAALVARRYPFGFAMDVLAARMHDDLLEALEVGDAVFDGACPLLRCLLNDRLDNRSKEEEVM
jgi:capsular polysaccharide biosynthesis protein/Mrp family chromosome partitioning ATPase